MTARLYIAAKAPRAGLVKTRLAGTIGEEAAVTLYRAFLSDLGARFASAPFPLGWYITPPDAWPEIARLVGKAGMGAQVIAQGDGDWTARQRALFEGAAARGEDRTILVASDSPQLQIDVIVDAFRALDEHDLVCGPVHDGGYYLLGMRGWHNVLSDIRMSTGTVLDEIIDRAHSMNLTVALVETTFDIDEAADLDNLAELARVQPDLAATRAALDHLRLQTARQSPL